MFAKCFVFVHVFLQNLKRVFEDNPNYIHTCISHVVINTNAGQVIESKIFHNDLNIYIIQYIVYTVLYININSTYIL